jgi:hypothetical protein
MSKASFGGMSVRESGAFRRRGQNRVAGGKPYPNPHCCRLRQMKIPTLAEFHATMPAIELPAG